MNDEYDDYSNDDVFSASELAEMDRDAEFRMDAEDDARNTAEIKAEESDSKIQPSRRSPRFR
ncbi:hypothetical protein ABZ490_25960 [Streptomyces sp. NPDC005811]|uniref:hypothetical protein n=1 Tax=Streptomyces sp. NPDC005811 TaxID=3154565 RepID=UPI0033C3C65A